MFQCIAKKNRIPKKSACMFISVIVNYNTMATQADCSHSNSRVRSLTESQEILRRMNMKSLHLLLSVVLVSLTTVALAQSDAQKSFDKLKTLAGSWEGHVQTDPPQAEIEGKAMQVS